MKGEWIPPPHPCPMHTQGHLATFGDIFWLSQLGLGVATGVWWREAREAVQRPTTQRSVHHNKELSGPNVNSAEDEKLFPRLKQKNEALRYIPKSTSVFSFLLFQARVRWVHISSDCEFLLQQLIQRPGQAEKLT